MPLSFKIIFFLFFLFLNPKNLFAQNNISFFPTLKNLNKSTNSLSKTQIIKYLTSKNSTDILIGLNHITKENWGKTQIYVSMLLDSPQKHIASKALQIMIANKSSLAGFYLRKMIMTEQNTNRKVKAIQLLASLNSSGDTNFFLKLLNTENLKIRTTVINVLGSLKEKSAIEPLISLLTSDSRITVKQSVVSALRNIGGKEVVIPIMSTLSYKNPHLLQTTITALFELNAKQAVPLMKRLLKNNKSKKLHLTIFKVFRKWDIYDSEVQNLILNCFKSSQYTYGDKLKLINYLPSQISVDVLLELLELSSYEKMYEQLLSLAGTKIKLVDYSILHSLIFNPDIHKNGRFLLMNFLIDADGIMTTDIVLKLLRLNYINLFDAVTILYKNSKPESINLISRLYEKSDNIILKRYILNLFIKNKDDRIVDQYVHSLKHYPQLEDLLITIALQTLSPKLTNKLINKLNKQLINNSFDITGIFLGLTKYPYDYLFESLAQKGYLFHKINLLNWSKLMISRLTPLILRNLQNVRDVQNKNFIKERLFIYAFASFKNMPVPSKYRKLHLTNKMSYQELLLWVSLHGQNKTQIPKSMKKTQIIRLLQLLPSDNPPVNWKYLLDKNDISITRELARFDIPFSIRKKLILKTSEPILKINASLNPLDLPYFQWLKLYKNQNSSYVKFNLLLNFKDKTQILPLIFELKNKFQNSQQWQAFLSKISNKKLQKTLIKKWNILPLKKSHLKNSLIRFILQNSFDENRKQLVFSLPSGGFRAYVLQTNQKEIIITYLTQGYVKINHLNPSN